MSLRCISARQARLTALLVVAAIPARGASAQSYTMTRLGFLTQPREPGWGYSFASGINASGQVIGASIDGSMISDFLTGPSGVGMFRVGPSTGYTLTSGATGVNAAGQVIGVRFDPTTWTQSAYITGPNGQGYTLLDLLITMPTGINASGRVVGTHNTVSSTEAMITGPNGQGAQGLGWLDVPAGWAPVSGAGAINDLDQVTGSSRNGVPVTAFVTDANGVGMRSLGITGTDHVASGHSYGLGINNAGQVVGYVYGDDGTEAFVTGPGGLGVTSLGFAGLANVNSFGWAINAIGAVVGQIQSKDFSVPFPFASSGFVYTGSGGTRLLDELVLGLGTWHVVDARGVNDVGQIAATVVNPDTFEHEAVLLTPYVASTAAPEPATLALTGAGLVALGVAAHRRRRPMT
jgi:hypothetical protein